MNRKQLLSWLGLIGLMVLGHVMFFVGYLASDDMLYIGQSSRYLSGDYSPPKSHWGFRYPVVLPLALLGLLVDYTERVLALVPLAYWGATLFLMVWFIHREAGHRQAVYGGVMVATLPLFVVQSSILGVDITEAFFLFAGFVALYLADVAATPRYRNYFLMGVLVGFGMLTRESAYGFLLVLGVFFILGGFRRWQYYLIGIAGVASVLSMEWIYYLAAGEGPWYRLVTIATSHGTIGVREGNFEAGSGNISDNRLIGPPLALLLNQEFASLYWLSVVAAIYLYRQSGTEYKQLLKYTGITFLVYFVWIGYSGAVRPLPRYFAFPSLLAMLPIALMLGKLKSRALRVIIFSTIVGTNIVALSLENIHPRFAPRAVSEVATRSNYPVVTDRRTAWQANSFMRFVRDRKVTISEHAPPKAAYVYGAVDGIEPPADLKPLLTPKSRIEESTPPKLLFGHLLDLSGVGRMLPRNLYHYLAIRNPKVRFYLIDVAESSVVKG